jgi:hypothetical protein
MGSEDVFSVSEISIKKRMQASDDVVMQGVDAVATRGSTAEQPVKAAELPLFISCWRYSQ